MPEFASYDPAAQRTPLADDEMLLRPAVLADLDPLADIAHAREGGDREEHRRRLEAEIRQQEAEPGAALLLAALVTDRMAAFGRCGHVTPPPDAPRNCIPPGWYLTGVIVSPTHRRLGLATALTHARLRWLFERTPRAYYFVNSSNEASIVMHAALGFREIARDIWASSRAFVGGIGLLFSLDRDSYTPPRRP